jgi:hypothetical protein
MTTTVRHYPSKLMADDGRTRLPKLIFWNSFFIAGIIMVYGIFYRYVFSLETGNAAPFKTHQFRKINIVAAG